MPSESIWYLLRYRLSAIDIRQDVDRLGSAPFLRWLNALSDEAQARVATALDRLERGNLSSIKSVGAGSRNSGSTSAPDIASTSAGMVKRW